MHFVDVDVHDNDESLQQMLEKERDKSINIGMMHSTLISLWPINSARKNSR